MAQERWEGPRGLGDGLSTPESESVETSECSQDSEACWVPLHGFSSPPTKLCLFF